MGKQFFQDWALWEKMTFVLACCIVATIFAGTCKLTYSNWRLRKYDQVATARALQTLNLLEAQTPSEEELKAEEKDNIPFGIRAIESGIQIHGVWISQNNTPIGSVASSFDESREPRHFHTEFELTQLEIPQPIYGHSGRSSLKAPSFAFVRAVSAERIPSSGSHSSSSKSSTHNLQSERSSKPGDHNDSLHRNSSTLLALEGSGSRGTPSLSEPDSSGTSTTSETSTHNSDETTYMAISIPKHQIERPYEPAHIKPIAVPILGVESKWNLDLLQSHRLSHVAETGQLTPRIRRPGFSGDWANIMLAPKPNETEESNVEHVAPQLPSSLQLPSQLDLFPAPPQRSFVPPSTNDIQLSNLASQTVSSLKTYQPRGNMSETELSEHACELTLAQCSSQPRGAQYVQPTHPTHGNPIRPDESEHPQNSIATRNGREAQVLRKVNSGFIILHPGTLAFAPQENLDDTGSAAGEKRQSRRLRKKRWRSGDYRQPSFGDNF